MRKKISDETRQKLIRYERRTRIKSTVWGFAAIYLSFFAMMFIGATEFFSDFSILNMGLILMFIMLSAFVVCLLLPFWGLGLLLNRLTYKTYDPDKTEFFGRFRHFTQEYCEYRRRCDIYADSSEVYTEVFTCTGKRIGFLELVIELQSALGQKRKRGVSAAAYRQIRKGDRVVTVTGKQLYEVYGVYPGKFAL